MFILTVECAWSEKSVVNMFSRKKKIVLPVNKLVNLVLKNKKILLKKCPHLECIFHIIKCDQTRVFFISENIYLIVLLWKQYHKCVNIPWCEIPEWIKLLIYNVHNLKSLVVFFFTTIYLLSSVKSHELCIPPPNACCSYHGVVYIFFSNH